MPLSTRSNSSSGVPSVLFTTDLNQHPSSVLWLMQQDSGAFLPRLAQSELATLCIRTSPTTWHENFAGRISCRDFGAFPSVCKDFLLRYESEANASWILSKISLSTKFMSPHWSRAAYLRNLFCTLALDMAFLCSSKADSDAKRFHALRRFPSRWLLGHDCQRTGRLECMKWKSVEVQHSLTFSTTALLRFFS